MKLQLPKKDDTTKINHKTNKFLVRKRLILERGPPPRHAIQHDKTLYKALCEQTDFLVKLFGEDDEKVKYMVAARKEGLRKAKKKKKSAAKDSKIGTCSAIASGQVQVCDYTTLRAIEGMEHFNTVSLAFENFYSNRKLADVFNFGDKSGWKAAFGEDKKAGWVKQIPVGLLPKGFKVGGQAPRGLTAKVFIEYLERVA